MDDGSRFDTQPYFDRAEKEFGCQIVRHYINFGQGRAFKSAFNYFWGKYGKNDKMIGVVECDCDGQHVLDDVNRCAELLRENQDKFILGVRDFNGKNIPFRSRFGNKCTSFVFKVFCGLDISDTQTGLKGIPKRLIPIFAEVPGERFEYASSVLLEAKKHGVENLQFPIRTIYLDGNKSSHFNPIVDSIRIYSLIFKYLLSSLSASIVDLACFYIWICILKGVSIHYVLLATYIAKVISCTYSYFMNKNLVFCKKGDNVKTIAKWVCLCAVQATLSGLLTTVLVNKLGIPEMACKIMVDVILFIFSFQVQGRWVFKKA